MTTRWSPVLEPAELDPATIRILLDALLALDVEYLMQHPRTPGLYASGVVYRREPRERWSTIPHLLRRGHGDCEDLASYRAADLRVRFGENATTQWTRKARARGGYLYHITVRRADGSTEDPSRLLGM